MSIMFEFDVVLQIKQIPIKNIIWNLNEYIKVGVNQIIISLNWLDKVKF